MTFWLSLFYSIPLLALTDWLTDRETTSLASRGLEEPAHASRGLEEFFLAITTGKKKSSSRLSGGLSVFGAGGYAINYDRKKKRYRREIFITSGKKKSSSHLSGGYAINYDRKKKDTGVKFFGCAVLAITNGKKRYSRLSVGCAVLGITTGKKKRYSRLSDGLCCCIVFCSGGKFLLRNFITTGKKSMSVFLVAISIFVLVQLELNLIQIH